jgi:hypothetical protein
MPQKSQKFMRNVRHVPVSLRLSSGRRIDLRPRGQRGDCVPVNAEEMNDEIFLGNLDVLFEVIPASEAKDVISKQTTNQRRLHPALSGIRNERGEEYTRGVVMQSSEEAQGTYVASVDERGSIQRFVAPGTVEQPLPEPPSDVPPEEVTDWVARQKNVEGPEAGLAGMKVT